MKNNPKPTKYSIYNKKKTKAANGKKRLNDLIIKIVADKFSV